jgi:hypothetical protein
VAVTEFQSYPKGKLKSTNHALLLCTIRLDVDNVSDVVWAKVGGQMDGTRLLEAALEPAEHLAA